MRIRWGKVDQKYKRENDEKCVRKEQAMSTLDMESKNHIFIEYLLSQYLGNHIQRYV